MTSELGLRELKKRQTRQRITETALRLFAERGFDNVRVAEIARAAQVSEATVFNYFTGKEALIYEGMDAFEDALLDAVRERPTGTSTVRAFREFVLSSRGSLLEAEPIGVQQIATAARIIHDSPALQAYELRSVERYTRLLAELIATELNEQAPGPHDGEAYVVAHALMGVNRAMKDVVHAHAMAGHDAHRIVTDAAECGRRAMDLLERGLICESASR
ncbi:TetR family transcriptional regulator [Nocardia sp. NPDC051030]|uniref:TetR/AcrR family transcriptional regulator n=1 Tax=Nocardia sp. NPDC051030 TaxID=3155162 RepID=UPI00343ED552